MQGAGGVSARDGLPKGMVRIERLVCLGGYRRPAYHLPVVVAAAKGDDPIASDVHRAEDLRVEVKVEYRGNDAAKDAIRIAQRAGDNQTGAVRGA
jgi:hypothetical protein